ncbi:MAG: tetratricopeptide repeat protein [Candidatus Acidiferrales bacterium]
MQSLIRRFLVVALGCGTLAGFVAAQSSAKTTTVDASSSTQKGLGLAEGGHCREALPILKKSAPLSSDKQLKLKAGLATVRCGLSLNQIDIAVNALLWLNREFPSDPDVLYVTTHAYSDLSTRAALQLADTAPLSTQAHELNAEALESQARWDEAAAEYNQILKQQPDIPGIHYRLGRIILSKPATPTTADDARTEFQAELKIDPNNAGAEYVLGELSRQTQQWDEAIKHFSQASKLDANFANAFLALGLSLNSAGRYAEAIAPLETEVKLQPANPTGHYQLTIAYRKAGRKEDAEREMALFQKTSEKATKEQHTEGQQQPPQ